MGSLLTYLVHFQVRIPPFTHHTITHRSKEHQLATGTCAPRASQSCSFRKKQGFILCGHVEPLPAELHFFQMENEKVVLFFSGWHLFISVGSSFYSVIESCALCRRVVTVAFLQKLQDGSGHRASPVDKRLSACLSFYDCDDDDTMMIQKMNNE